MFMLNCIQYLLIPNTHHPSYLITPLNIFIVFHMNYNFTLNPKERVKPSREKMNAIRECDLCKSSEQIAFRRNELCKWMERTV